MSSFSFYLVVEGEVERSMSLGQAGVVCVAGKSCLPAFSCHAMHGVARGRCSSPSRFAPAACIHTNKCQSLQDGLFVFMRASQTPPPGSGPPSEQERRRQVCVE